MSLLGKPGKASIWTLCSDVFVKLLFLKMKNELSCDETRAERFQAAAMTNLMCLQLSQ